MHCGVGFYRCISFMLGDSCIKMTRYITDIICGKQRSKIPRENNYSKFNVSLKSTLIYVNRDTAIRFYLIHIISTTTTNLEAVRLPSLHINNTLDIITILNLLY